MQTNPPQFQNLPRKSVTTKKEVSMSKKRMMPRSVRIYYEQMKKKRLEQELIEYARNLKELERYKENAYRGMDY